MDDGSMTLIIALVFLVACSAFFSASETAFSSLNQIRLKSRAEDGDASAARVLAMAEKYDKLLSTILIGNNIESIAAASILSKTYRDDYMLRLHEEYPVYRWDSNKGYPAKAHREAIRRHGVTPYHRMSYNLLGDGQMELFAPAETKGR